MPTDFKKNVRQKDMPENFSQDTSNTVCRIDENHHVIGVLYLENNIPTMCTVHESMAQALAARLPVFTELARHAICEIDVLDELVAYRIETKTTELLVAPAGHCAACVVHKKSKPTPKRY